MKLFESNKPVTKNFNWGKLIFKDKYHIIADTPENVIVFHRYGVPRGYYGKSWRLFRQELMRKKLNSIYDIYKYAERYEIDYFVKTVKSRHEGAK